VDIVPADLSPAGIGPAVFSPVDIGPADLSPAGIGPADFPPTSFRHSELGLSQRDLDYSIPTVIISASPLHNVLDTRSCKKNFSMKINLVRFYFFAFKFFLVRCSR
jgi:hypothetical protein